MLLLCDFSFSSFLWDNSTISFLCFLPFFLLWRCVLLNSGSGINVVSFTFLFPLLFFCVYSFSHFSETTLQSISPLSYHSFFYADVFSWIQVQVLMLFLLRFSFFWSSVIFPFSRFSETTLQFLSSVSYHSFFYTDVFSWIPIQLLMLFLLRSFFFWSSAIFPFSSFSDTTLQFISSVSYDSFS